MEIGTIIWGILFFIVGGIGTYAWQRERRYQQLVSEFKEWMDPYQRRLLDVNRFLLNEEVLRFAFSDYPPALIRRLWEDLVKDSYTEIDPMDGERCLRRK